MRAPPADGAGRTTQALIGGQGIGAAANKGGSGLFFPPGLIQAKTPTFSDWNTWMWVYRKNNHVSSCVDLVASAMVFGGGRFVPAEDDDSPDESDLDAAKAFFKSPSPQYTAGEVWADLCFAAALSNRCYTEIGYNELGVPAALYDIPQGSMYPNPDANGEVKGAQAFAQVIDRGQEKSIRYLPEERILWTRQPGMRDNSLNPLSPIETLEVPISTCIEGGKHLHSFFSTGGKAGMVFVAEAGTFNRTDAIEFLKYLKAQYTSTTGGSFLPLILYNGLKPGEMPDQLKGFASVINVQDWGGRAVCGAWRVDPRLLAFPGENSLGGKGDRERALEEFHLNAVNPRKEAVSDIVTEQILWKRFGAYRWRWELVPFVNQLEATSQKMMADTIATMGNSGLLDLNGPKEYNFLRRSVLPGLPKIQDVDMSAVRQSAMIQQFANQSPTMLVNNVSELTGLKAAPVVKQAGFGAAAAPTQAPAEPAASDEDRSRQIIPRRAARTALEKRTPYDSIERHLGRWVTKSLATVTADVHSMLERGRPSILRIFDLPSDAEKLRAWADINPLPGGGKVHGDFSREVKAFARASYQESDGELRKLEKDLKLAGRANRDDFVDAGLSTIDAYINSYTRTNVEDDLFSRLVAEEHRLFNRAVRSRWSPKELERALRQSTDAIADRHIATFVRTAGTEFWNMARRRAGSESGIVLFYEYSSIMDDRVTDICAHLDGVQLADGDKDLAAIDPPNHFNCRATWSFGTDADFTTDRKKIGSAIEIIPTEFGGDA